MASSRNGPVRTAAPLRFCSIPRSRMDCSAQLVPPGRVVRSFEHPSIKVGSRQEYLNWKSRARIYLRELGRDPAALERVDATFNYRLSRILLFNLPDPTRELSVAETISHEILHALLEQMQERWGARALDRVVKPVGDANRVGGI
jgi:hypothetical protein